MRSGQRSPPLLCQPFDSFAISKPAENDPLGITEIPALDGSMIDLSAQVPLWQRLRDTSTNRALVPILDVETCRPREERVQEGKS
jgi:hypothetical protein